MEVVNSLWVEKYRPKKLEDLVLPEEYRSDFQKCIEKQEIGHFTFHGPPGGGKTACARILASKNGVLQNPRDNLLEINGSAKETRGITFVQDVIEPFLKIPPAGNDKHRIVFIDEADYMTDAAFHSSRSIIERYSSNGRFIFTCNYLSKLPEAIQSRFQIYAFKQLPLEFVEDYCKKILTTEKIEFSDRDLKFVVGNLYPDIRRIVNSLQRSSMSDKLKISQDVILTAEKVLISSIVEITNAISNNEDHRVNSLITTMIGQLSDHDLEFRSVYSNLFYSEGLPIPAKVIVNRYSNEHGDCLVPSMHFMSMVFEIVKVLQSYRSLTK